MADHLPNGIGGLVADDLITAKPIILSDRVWYVYSVTGSDANNSGKDRKFPKATIQGALDAFSGDDHLIVCMDGHKEEISSSIGLSARVSIAGEGATAGVPNVELTLAPGSVDMFGLEQSSGCIEFRNLRFRSPGNAASPANSTGSYITGNQPAVHFIGCYFDFDRYSQNDGIKMASGADYWRFENCFFRNVDVVQTAPPDRPRPAIATSGATAIACLVMCGCVFDGGIDGFDDGSQNPYSFDASVNDIQPIRVLKMSLLRGADFKLHSDSTGYVNPPVATGHAKVEW